MSAEDIQARLEAISEELADLALDRLREALAAGADDEAVTGNDAAGGGRRRRPGGPQADEERRLTRARRAVDNAVAILAAGGET